MTHREITLPGPRPCSIREDGHRAAATHAVDSDAYGFTAGVANGRLFCAGCAQAEVALLREFGFGAVLVPVRATRTLVPAPPMAWEEPIAYTIDPETGEEEVVWRTVGPAPRRIPASA